MQYKKTITLFATDKAALESIAQGALKHARASSHCGAVASDTREVADTDPEVEQCVAAMTRDGYEPTRKRMIAVGHLPGRQPGKKGGSK